LYKKNTLIVQKTRTAVTRLKGATVAGGGGGGWLAGVHPPGTATATAGENSRSGVLCLVDAASKWGEFGEDSVATGSSL